MVKSLLAIEPRSKDTISEDAIRDQLSRILGGTAFLACEESGAGRLHREAVLGCRTHRADTRLYGTARTGNPQPIDRGAEPKGIRDPAVSTATRSCKKPINRGGGGRPIRSSASVGRAKRQSFYVYRRIAFCNPLVKEVSQIARPVVQWSANRNRDTFEFTTRRTRTMGTSNITDKVVVITGASSGLGHSTAELLARHEAKVVLAARRKTV